MNYAAIQRAQQRYTDAVREQNEENRLENLASHPEDAEDFYASMEASFEPETPPPSSAFSRMAATFVVNRGLAIQEEGAPEDYWRNPSHHKILNILLPVKLYLHLSMLCHSLIYGNEKFNLFIIGTIIIAGILVGVQTYPIGDSPVVQWIDLVILGIFTLEVGIKIILEGLRPWRYWTGSEWKWNCFDFGIVALSMPFINIGGTESVKLLRLVRLARLGKLIRKIPPLQMIVKGLIGGMSSIGYVLLLLLLVLYLYGVMGFYLLGTSNPFYFGTVPQAMVTLFRVMTLENWGDVLFVSVRGCKSHPNFYFSSENKTPQNKLLWCDNPDDSIYPAVLGTLFFVTFILLCGFVMVSLFISSVISSMNDSMSDLKDMQESKKKEMAIARSKRQAKEIAESKKEVLSKGGSLKSLSPMSSATASPTSPVDRKGIEPTTPGLEPEKIHEPLDDYSIPAFDASYQNEGDAAVSSGSARKRRLYGDIFYIVTRSYGALKQQRMRRKVQAMLAKAEEMQALMRIAVGDEMDQTVNAVVAPVLPSARAYLALAHYCRRFADHPQFTNYITLCILVASFNVGAQTDNRVISDERNNVLLEFSSDVILYSFTAEVVLKVIGEGFHPWRYFHESWNVFDFLIVVASFIKELGKNVSLLRLLRLLRVLKLVRRLPQLQLIIGALLAGLGSIAWVGLVLVLFLYVFAIIGMILFDANDPWHYGSLHLTLINLFRITTLDNWSEIMYVSQFGCHRFGDIYWLFPEQCKAPAVIGIIAVVYHIIVVLMTAQILLSLFIGVITTSMDDASQKQQKAAKNEEEVLATGESLGLAAERIAAFKAVFDLMDLSGLGELSEDDLLGGLQQLGLDLPSDKFQDFLTQIDPDRKGLSYSQFITFVSLTPMFKKGSTAGLLISTLKKKADLHHSKDKDKKRSWLPAWLVSGSNRFRDKTERIEAALVLQSIWKAKQAKRRAQKIAEAKKTQKQR